MDHTKILIFCRNEGFIRHCVESFINLANTVRITKMNIPRINETKWYPIIVRWLVSGDISLVLIFNAVLPNTTYLHYTVYTRGWATSGKICFCHWDWISSTNKNSRILNTYAEWNINIVVLFREIFIHTRFACVFYLNIYDKRIKSSIKSVNDH